MLPPAARHGHSPPGRAQTGGYRLEIGQSMLSSSSSCVATLPYDDVAMRPRTGCAVPPKRWWSSAPKPSLLSKWWWRSRSAPKRSSPPPPCRAQPDGSGAPRPKLSSVGPPKPRDVPPTAGPHAICCPRGSHPAATLARTGGAELESRVSRPPPSGHALCCSRGAAPVCAERRPRRAISRSPSSGTPSSSSSLPAPCAVYTREPPRCLPSPSRPKPRPPPSPRRGNGSSSLTGGRSRARARTASAPTSTRASITAPPVAAFGRRGSPSLGLCNETAPRDPDADGAKKSALPLLLPLGGV
mmetsp:Transcript_906/g.2405  ORF Transcript_906/g.2405 Transcript_906/m.2405 type:complete len:299 (-) Transcript_906:556-1452(-)